MIATPLAVQTVAPVVALVGITQDTVQDPTQPADSVDTSAPDPMASTNEEDQQGPKYLPYILMAVLGIILGMRFGRKRKGKSLE